jgi:hypothetical protein
MILYNLTCSTGHEFEAWFRNGDAYGEQTEAGAVSCPHCGDVEVRKAPMAPSLGKGVAKREDARRDVLVELRRMVESQFEDVGGRFAEEARQIHYGEAEARPIYGQATPEEVKDLLDEEIPVLPLPAKVGHDA